jgi:uncharacterized membrane protein HdeD (DUF308 family)
MKTVGWVCLLCGAAVILGGVFLLLPGEVTGGADIPLGLFLIASGYLGITLTLNTVRRENK